MTFVNITASVGKNGQNKMQDTMPMQILLNKFIMPGCLKPTPILLTDGIVGNKTISAIRDFQHRICGFSNPDGRIDPGGETLHALNGPLIWAKPLAADTTREWAIALGAIGSGLVEFKLVNRATGVVHKLSIRNPGILPVSVNKSFCDRWVSFKTFLASGFGDFNNVSASFSKAGTVGEYKMTFGWLGSVPVLPYPGHSFAQTCPAPISLGGGSGSGSASLLGCSLVLGSGKLGAVKVDQTYSQQLVVPDTPPYVPSGPNLWSPFQEYRQLLLSP